MHLEIWKVGRSAHGKKLRFGTKKASNDLCDCHNRRHGLKKMAVNFKTKNREARKACLKNKV